jgi:hypothetical protein
MYTPLAAEIVRRETSRAARRQSRGVPRTRPPVAARRLLAEALRRSADRLAPECR